MHVLHLTEPKALANPKLIAFLRKVLTSGVLLTEINFDTPAVAEEIFHYVNDPDHFIVLGMENGEFTSLALGFFSSSALAPLPTIGIFYNEGSAEVRQAVSQELLDIVTERGYTEVLALNTTGRHDRAWAKVVGAAGTYHEAVGSLVKFKVA